MKYETTRKNSCGSRVNSRMMFSRQIGDQSYTSSHVDYYPFGLEQSTTADSRAALVQYGFPAWMYSGNELDQLNGLNQYDFHARWLDNVVARFTTPDPLAESHYEESPYVYCGNDPVNQVDPLGLDWYYNQEGEFPKYIKGHEENKNYKYHDKTRMLESDHYKYFFGEYGSIYIVEKMTGSINGFLPEPQVMPTGTSLSYNVYSYESLNTMMGNGGGGSALLNKPDNWVNGIGVGLSAVSLSTGTALERTMAYHGGVSTIKPQQVMFKLPVGEAYVPTKVVSAISNSATHIGYGLAGVSAALTIIDGYNKGWQNHHTADLAINAGLTYLSIACPVAGLVVGGLYFVGDLASQYYTGRSITENVFDR